MTELIIFVVMLTVLLLVASLVKITINVNGVGGDSSAEHRLQKLEERAQVNESQEALDNFYKTEGQKLPNYDDILAEVNTMLLGDDTDEEG